MRFDGSNFNEFFPKESKYKYLGISKIKKLNNFIYINYEKNGLLERLERNRTLPRFPPEARFWM